MFEEILAFWLVIIFLGGLSLCACISSIQQERENKLETRIKQLENKIENRYKK